MPELHHWSYNQDQFIDIIPLSIKDHNLLHRNMDYDQSLKLYRDKEGVLLDTKESHINLLEKCLLNDVKYITKKEKKLLNTF